MARRFSQLVFVLLIGFCVFLFPDRSNAQDSAALTGIVSSQEEGAMEGVLVGAKRAGSTITVTVVTDAKGRYSFPRNRIEPGDYTLKIRASGYELDGAAKATVAAGSAAEANLKLRKTDDLAYQLSNGEWLYSMTGTEKDKQTFLNCVACHSLERIMRSRYNAQEFAQVFQRMGNYSQGSTPVRPQRRPGRRGPGSGSGSGDMEAIPERGSARFMQQAEFAASVNLSSSSKWSYPLKPLPRPKGKNTRVIITEYDLPRPESLPHDAVADGLGSIWYGDFGSQFLGKLDPKTGKTTEYPVPVTNPGYPTGALDIGFDKDGLLYMGTMYQGVVQRFDPKTKEFQNWKNPKISQGDGARTAMVTPGNVNVDGKIWVGADDEYQVDLKSGAWTPIDYKKGLPKDSPAAKASLGSYGVASDSKNNFYGMNLGGTYITRVDAKTMDVKAYATPTPDSGPRRGHMDAQDRLWFAEYRGNRIGMFDTKAEKFQEWEMPTPWTNPYDAVLDNAGYAWAGGMTNDHIVRLNTKNNEISDYLLPRMTNVRRVNVDNSTNPPTFWVGNNLGATIIKVEPLEP